MKLYKHFSIIDRIEDDGEELEIQDENGGCICLDKKGLKASKPLLEGGRIMCVITDQAAQGRFYFVYIKILSEDFGKDGWYVKNMEYYSNPRTQLEGCPGFILVWQK